MNKVWNWCLNHNWKIKTKRKTFLLINSLSAMFIGLILWYVLQMLVVDFKSVDWLLCAIGYAGVGTYIGSLIYLYNHEQ